jgi:hypothetical protein
VTLNNTKPFFDFFLHGAQAFEADMKVSVLKITEVHSPLYVPMAYDLNSIMGSAAG